MLNWLSYKVTQPDTIKYYLKWVFRVFIGGKEKSSFNKFIHVCFNFFCQSAAKQFHYASTNLSKQIPSDKIGDCRKINREASQNDKFKKSSGSAHLCLILDTCQYFHGVMFWLMCTRNLEVTLSLYTCVE